MLKRARFIEPDDIIVKDATLVKVKHNGPSKNKIFMQRQEYIIKGVDLRNKKLVSYITDGLRIYNTLQMDEISTKVKSAQKVEVGDWFLVDYSLWKNNEQYFNYAICVDVQRNGKTETPIEHQFIHHDGLYPSTKLFYLNDAFISIITKEDILEFLLRDIDEMVANFEEPDDKYKGGPQHFPIGYKSRAT